MRGSESRASQVFSPAILVARTISLDQSRLMPDAPPPLPKSQPVFSRRNSTMFKLLGVGALILLMLIPLLMIEGGLNDRLIRRNEAVADSTASWGKEQNIIGPVLCVPYLH